MPEPTIKMPSPTLPKEVPKEVPPTPEVKPIERGLVQDYLNELKNKIFSDKYVGKSGYNPYTWWHNKMRELEERFNNGNTTQDLYREILSVGFSEPTAQNPKSLPFRKFPTVEVKENK